MLELLVEVMFLEYHLLNLVEVKDQQQMGLEGQMILLLHQVKLHLHQQMVLLFGELMFQLQHVKPSLKDFYSHLLTQKLSPMSELQQDLIHHPQFICKN